MHTDGETDMGRDFNERSADCEYTKGKQGDESTLHKA
jgi:hypothetical protein